MFMSTIRVMVTAHMVAMATLPGEGFPVSTLLLGVLCKHHLIKLTHTQTGPRAGWRDVELMHARVHVR